jgi:hypothetical protein
MTHTDAKARAAVATVLSSRHGEALASAIFHLGDSVVAFKNSPRARYFIGYPSCRCNAPQLAQVPITPHQVHTLCLRNLPTVSCDGCPQRYRDRQQLQAPWKWQLVRLPIKTRSAASQHHQSFMRWFDKPMREISSNLFSFLLYL